MTPTGAGIAGQTWDWLTDPAHYTGSDGVLVRLVEHAAICAVALGIAGAVALPVAVWLGHVGRGGALVTSLANAARAVPVLAVLILFAVGPLGVGTSAAVAALVIFAVPPMLTNGYTGVRSVDADARQSAVGMGMSGWQLLTRVEIPLALPLVAAGVRIATVQVWATATLAAIVGSGGLGRFIVDGYGVQDYGQVYGGVTFVAIFAVLLEVGLGGVERWLRRRVGGSSGEPAATPAVAVP